MIPLLLRWKFPSHQHHRQDANTTMYTTTRGLLHNHSEIQAVQLARLLPQIAYRLLSTVRANPITWPQFQPFWISPSWVEFVGWLADIMGNILSYYNDSSMATLENMWQRFFKRYSQGFWGVRGKNLEVEDRDSQVAACWTRDNTSQT